jgi:hypothetical protein
MCHVAVYVALRKCAICFVVFAPVTRPTPRSADLCRSRESMEQARKREYEYGKSRQVFLSKKKIPGSFTGIRYYRVLSIEVCREYVPYYVLYFFSQRLVNSRPQSTDLRQREAVPRSSNHRVYVKNVRFYVSSDYSPRRELRCFKEKKCTPERIPKAKIFPQNSYLAVSRIRTRLLDPKIRKPYSAVKNGAPQLARTETGFPTYSNKFAVKTTTQCHEFSTGSLQQAV